MNSHNKRYYELTILNKLERYRHLKDKLTDLLKKGKITHEEMTRQLGNIVGDDKIRKYLYEGQRALVVNFFPRTPKDDRSKSQWCCEP